MPRGLDTRPAGVQLAVKTSHEEVREASPGRGVGQGQGGRPGGGGGRVGVCPLPMASFGSVSCASGGPFRPRWLRSVPCGPPVYLAASDAPPQS